MTTIILATLAVLSLATSVVYARSARRRLRLARLIETDNTDDREGHSLAFASYRKEAHTSIVYALIAPAAAVVALFDGANVTSAVFGVLILPAGASLWWSRTLAREARMARNRYDLERRASEALEQEQLAPKAWAARLARALRSVASIRLVRGSWRGTSSMCIAWDPLGLRQSLVMWLVTASSLRSLLFKRSIC